MSDSLIIANSIELLGGQPYSTNPRCLGAQFRLQPGFDLSAAQPTTDFVASLILDGERPFGRRASNRSITLPILISAPNRYILAAAREVLEEAIDQQFWTLQWTRDPGTGGTPLPLILDCFRANPSVPVYNTNYEKQAQLSAITISFPALPYGRSDVQTQVAFAAPVPSTPPPPPAPVVLDAFTTINSPQCQQSTQCVVGPNTCFWDPGNYPANDPQGQVTPLVYGATFPAPLNLTSMTSLQMWFGLGSRYYYNLHGQAGCAKLNFYITLTDSSGNTLSFTRGNLLLPSSQVTGVPAFSRVNLTIPQNSTTFNYASVASYVLTVTNRDTSPRLAWVCAYIDALTAYPASQTATPVVRGNIYTLYGVVGTVHAPVSLQFQQAAVAGTPSTLTTVGAGSYTVPAGTVYLKVEAVGGGGAGASETAAGFGGGGGGGEYAQEPVFAAVPAQVIPYSIGAGDAASPGSGLPTVFGPAPGGSMIVTANGGQSAASNSATGGLGGSGSGNTIHYPGGVGRTASGSVGGGGGSSAGSASAGLTPTGTSAVTLTGSGNWTCPAGVTQITVFGVGGGGGGASGSSSTNGAAGGGGESATEVFVVVPGTNYAYVVGAGGAGGVASGNAGANGISTTFIVGGTTLTAHGGIGGQPSGSGGSGGAGGSGSTAPAHYSGGQGGASYPYTGGGGSSAGTATGGNAGNGYGTAGAAPSGGGAGGAGSGGTSGAGSAGSVPGGGGGGSYEPTYAGGAGAAGTLVLTYPGGGSPTNNGAAAVAGGGAGGAGGPTANSAGSAGSVPGGGGGGADSTGTSEAGGAGGAGHIVVTPFASPAFKTLIVHRPSLSSPVTFMPMVSVGGGTGTPNGATQYTLPQPVTGVAADFGSTYTVVLIADTWNSPTAARTIYVTVTQYEYSGGASYTTSTTPVTVTPTGQVNNGILVLGPLTLPLKAVAPDNTGGYYTVSVTDTNTSDRFYDCLFLDTQGQTVIINEPTSGYVNYYLDEPSPLYDLGYMMGSQFGRPTAISVMDAAQAISGGNLTVEPDDNLLFAYCIEGAPAIGVSYYPRWYFDRLF